MTKLRDYQQTLKDGVYAAWNAGQRNVLAVAPTGAGKTVLFASILADHRGAAVAIAHRRELVSQMSLALAREGIRHRIIGSNDLQKVCASLHIQEVGRSYYDPSAFMACAGVDTLIRMPETDPIFAQTTLWIQDECFPAGTLVDGRPIETIQIGDMVTGFDERTGKFERRKVLRVFKSPIPKRMVRIKSEHHALECTEGHPFWTKRGWVEAINLKGDDDLLVHQLPEANFDHRGESAIQLSEKRSNLLRQGVRNDVPRCESQASSKCPASSLDMLHMQCGCQNNGAFEKDRTRLLQQGMFDELSSVDLFANNGENQSQTCESADDREQPDVSTRMPRKNGVDASPNQSSALSSWGQWKTSYSSGSSIGVDSVGYGVRSPACRGDAGTLTTSKTLQNRFGEPCDENCHRNRWGIARSLATPGARPTQDYFFDWQRVGSIEIYESSSLDGKRDSDDSNFVYNIEVEEFHTYVANGVVVHNCHHVLKSNKWGKACEMFPKARGLGVTATPMRADGKGLGRHADGLFEEMIVGPTMRELINRGFLTDYHILCPPNAVRLTADDVGDSGEFKPSSVKRELAKAKITGNVVEHYIKYARGKLGVTFASDIDNAGELAQAYRAAGVTAEVVTGETPTLIRAQILRRFAAKEIQQLVNVDLFGEGFDLPAIECVSMARPTASYGLYVQQFGRALRLLPGKERALIFDHVGNLERHNGPPDKPRVWSLDRRERQPKGAPSDVIPVRVCVQCSQPYERFYQCCPYCGFFPEPASRSGPEFVDGDLMLLDESTLKRMRGEIERIDGAPLYPQGLEPAAMGAIRRNHLERQGAQRELRAVMDLWGGWQKHLGRGASEAQRRFYLRYGVDVMSAYALNKADAELLTTRVNDELQRAGVIDASVNSVHNGVIAT